MQIRPTASTIGLIIYFFMHYFTFTQNLGLTRIAAKKQFCAIPDTNAITNVINEEISISNPY